MKITKNTTLQNQLETKMRTTPSALLTECSNILNTNQTQSEALAIQSMKQLNYVLQRLTKVSQEKIVNEEEIYREELPFSVAADAKKLAEAISVLMKGVNDSRKIRSHTYIQLKKLNKDKK